ncbi:MAG: mismatch repair protein [Bryobacteraceae bacterium]
MDSDAARHYQQRLQGYRLALNRLERLHIAIGNAQIGLASSIIVAALLALAWKLFSVLWLLVPIVAMVTLGVVHERALRRRARSGRVARFYEHVLDRVEDRWAGKGEAGDRFLDPEHPYARDLDLFGQGSLFEYLSTARTRGGEATLARWLLSPSEPADLETRHEAVRELAPDLDLREQLAVLGEDIRVGVNPEALAAWGEEPPRLASRGRWLVAGALSLLGVGTLAWWIFFGMAAPFVAVFVAARVFTYRIRGDIAHMIEAVEGPSHDLRLLSQVLVVLERRDFSSRRLAELRSALIVQGHPPSRRIARLYRLLELLDSRDNLALRVIDPVLLWTVHIVFAIETWRRTSGPHLRVWLDAVGEIEALLSLAGYSHEHPRDPFPEFVDRPLCFEAEQLGHPLIPEARCVRNDLRLDGGLRVLVVSGSNMSGKSTLLRAVGTNAVLAMAGAPVRATRLRISRLAVGASIRTLDSLQSGTSRFYAEITRLKQLVEMAGRDRPLLFLLDELLHGTNSHDRRIGAQGLVRALAARPAIGLLTTHDLALAQIADELAPLAVNMHFQDQIEEGRMRFDYRLRPGVVEHSNALDLMRSVGLDV